MSDEHADTVDRLKLDVTIRENCREEDINDFDSLLTEMFSAYYDSVQVNVTEESDV